MIKNFVLNNDDIANDNYAAGILPQVRRQRASNQKTN